MTPELASVDHFKVADVSSILTNEAGVPDPLATDVAKQIVRYLSADKSSDDTDPWLLLEVAENALGQAGIVFDRIQQAAPAAVVKVDHLGPTLAVLRQAHDEIHNVVEHRKRSHDKASSCQG